MLEFPRYTLTSLGPMRPECPTLPRMPRRDRAELITCLGASASAWAVLFELAHVMVMT